MESFFYFNKCHAEKNIYTPDSTSFCQLCRNTKFGTTKISFTVLNFFDILERFYSHISPGSLVSLKREKATSRHPGGVIMYRHSPSRNPRSKGIRVKHILQIFLLAVCIWLIYQVKHSHDKKKEFDQSNKTSLRGGVSNEILKLGRKDIHEKEEEMVAKNEKHGKEETTFEEEEEEIEEEPEDKTEEKEEEEAGGGNDQIDESEEEKSDAEVDQGEDFIDDEKERDEGDENESEEGDSEDNNGQIEKEISLEDSDDDGDDRNIHEAREENYKADDASSAVTHDAEILADENENGSLGKLNVLTETDILEVEKKETDTEDINFEENKTEVEAESGEMVKRENQSDVTTNETKENVIDKFESGLISNTTVTKGSDDHIETINNSTKVRTDGHDLSLLNGREIMLGLNQGRDDVADNNHNSKTETGDAKSNHSQFPNSFNNTDSFASEKILKFEVSVEAGNTTGSLTGKNDATEAQKSNTTEESGGTDDVLDSRTENYKNVQHDPIDSSD
ncbi:spore wall protein 2-like [Forsythia ovata]|uniref:Spore wall protein 2-like n=1 Tax=Forsythia ovata TaxID=205694 RepID=A0ABD1VIV1_9LAMI